MGETSGINEWLMVVCYSIFEHNFGGSVKMVRVDRRLVFDWSTWFHSPLENT